MSLNRLALSATIHCLTGCAIGEVLGMIIGTALGWGDYQTIALAVVLAFFFGYSLTMLPLLRGGLALATAVPLALASDTLSIAVMEIVDNAITILASTSLLRGHATRRSAQSNRATNDARRPRCSRTRSRTGSRS